MAEKEELDVFDELCNCIKEKRQLIKKTFEENFESDFRFTYSIAHDNKFGDCRHHIGINIQSKQNKYFIGFTGLNIDEDTGNIHSSIGRIQLFIGDGNPNIQHDKNCWQINYPNKKSTTIRNNQYTNKSVFNTGYRLFGNRKSGDILLTEENVLEFCNVIIKYIKIYEKNKIIS